MKIRQMCGGGVASAPWLELRRSSDQHALIWDRGGVAFIGSRSSSDWGPFRWRFHGLERLAEHLRGRLLDLRCLLAGGHGARSGEFYCSRCRLILPT